MLIDVKTCSTSFIYKKKINQKKKKKLIEFCFHSVSPYAHPPRWITQNFIRALLQSEVDKFFF